jgi:site-specific DNA recombinase
MKKPHQAPETRRIFRCAIYTRKSTEEGLEQEFNSLDAQRECGEAFIKSQAHEGWQCLPKRYDDGGYTGGNMDRPGLQSLLADIEAGRVDGVVTYKVDRFTRSLLDFAKMMETFERHKVAFVSVTQQINSATSMGRLMLNVLLSFAQFEREIIGERTRDKIAAARKKGKWAGGHPLLGYDIDPNGFKLVVNGNEAERVRAIFALYLEREGLVPVVQELQRRGWATKQWTTRKGQRRGGRPFTKTNLHQLLTNAAYTGKVRHKTAYYDGEHTAIISPDVWQRTQVLLQRHGRAGGAAARNQFGALLKGLLRCVPCGCAMTPATTTRKGNRRYRYYTCSSAQKRGWHTCPSKSIPAGEIEKFVVERIRCIGRDRSLLAETITAARAQAEARAADLASQCGALERDLKNWDADIRALVATGAGTPDVSRLADLHERVRLGERRLSELRAEIDALGGPQVTDAEVEQALSVFGTLWESLTPREQAEVVQSLVERVDFDGRTNQLSITFHPSGIQSLADELCQHHQGKRA